MSLRVLIVDSDPEETLFLRDALAEIQEGRYWDGWVQIEFLHAPTWSDAESILKSESPAESIDVVLLSLDLDDAHGPEPYRKLQTVAPHVPAILLAAENEADLALQQIREGAQDFIVPSRLDCASLAHAMRNAMERQRVLTSLRSAMLTDELSGLPSAAAFAISAERQRKLAERLGRRLMLILAEPRNIGEISEARGVQRKDLMLIEAADHLRSLASPADLLGRAFDTRFALAILDTPVESVEAAWVRIHLAAADHGINIGAAIMDADHPAGLDSLFDQAAQDLCSESAGSGSGGPPSSLSGMPATHHKAAGMRT